MLLNDFRIRCDFSHDSQQHFEGCFVSFFLTAQKIRLTNPQQPKQHDKHDECFLTLTFLR